MIRIRISNANHEADVRFPISENELQEKLAAVHAVNGQGLPQQVIAVKIYWPEEFSVLKDHYVDPDELNYLAKRMDTGKTIC